MNVLLIRHGQTDWNCQNKIQGWSDVDLNNKGISEINDLCKFIKKGYWDYVITSDLTRAKQTAEIISKKLNIPIVILANLRERNYGVFEGNYIECLKNENIQFNFLTKVPAGESYKHFYKRIFNCWDIIYRKYKSKKIIIVTHKGVMQIICSIVGISNNKCDDLSSVEFYFINLRDKELS